jgi:hypothetical protein
MLAESLPIFDKAYHSVPRDSGIFDTALGPIILIVFVVGLYFYYNSKYK